MTTVVHIDFETRSTVDLKAAGAYIYAAHPTTDIWCIAWAVNDGPVELWKMGDYPSGPLHKWAQRPEVLFTAHNAAFERAIWREILTKRYGWPEVPVERWRCTMAKAYAMALPGALADAAAAVGLEHQKDAKGHRIMMQLARPRSYLDPAGKADDGQSVPVWWDGEDRLSQLYAYCKQDVETERALDGRLVNLRESEQQLWFLDQRINDRGIYVDRKLCQKAKAIIAVTTAKLDTEMRRVTGGAVNGCSAVLQLTTWLQAQGLAAADSVAKDRVIDLLIRDDLTPEIRRALELRQEAAKTSTKKIDAFMLRTSADGRLRGTVQYCGAGNTGRWAARGVQLQNLPRPPKGWDQDTAIADLMTGDAEWVECLYG